MRPRCGTWLSAAPKFRAYHWPRSASRWRSQAPWRSGPCGARGTYIFMSVDSWLAGSGLEQSRVWRGGRRAPAADPEEESRPRAPRSRIRLARVGSCEVALASRSFVLDPADAWRCCARPRIRRPCAKSTWAATAWRTSAGDLTVSAPLSSGSPPSHCCRRWGWTTMHCQPQVRTVCVWVLSLPLVPGNQSSCLQVRRGWRRLCLPWADARSSTTRWTD